MEYPPELTTKYSPEGYELWLKKQGLPFRRIWVDRGYKNSPSEDVWWVVKWNDKLCLMMMGVGHGREKGVCLCCCTGNNGCPGPFVDEHPGLGFVPSFLIGLVAAIKDLECKVVAAGSNHLGNKACQRHPELAEVVWVPSGYGSGPNGFDGVPVWRKPTDY